MGSKRKFWFRDEMDRNWLFKYARPQSGEDWAEKVAAELAELLGLPCARAEMACCGDQAGVAVLDFTDANTELVHGNQLLARRDPGYPESPDRPRRPLPEYTVERVLQCLESPTISVPPLAPELRASISRPAELFVGYLLLDAWLGNGDRHHENWGVLEHVGVPRPAFSTVLAPSFDHASSLGRELTDAKRALVLTTRDPNQGLSAYASRARSAFCSEQGPSKRTISPLEAFMIAARSYPRAARVWSTRLARAQAESGRVLRRIPRSRMSETARAFTEGLLICNGVSLQARIQAC